MRNTRRGALQVVGWPPDDTEESVLGTNLHQATITNLRLGLIELASSLQRSGQPLPWQTLSQTGLSGLQHPDGSPYTVLPDIFVVRQPVDERRAVLLLGEVRSPLLVIEVLSETTYRNDLDLERGKGYSYARAGVEEYLVLDQLGEYMPNLVRGWRLENGVYVPWRPEPSRRWQSRTLPVGLGLEGTFVAVYGPDGRRQLREGEISAALASRDEQLARKDEEIAELRRRLEELGRE